MRVSDQPSLKLVERAEIQISRMGVLGEMTNLAGSGSSKMTSSLPLSPSTSKPCSSPAFFQVFEGEVGLFLEVVFGEHADAPF